MIYKLQEDHWIIPLKSTASAYTIRTYVISTSMRQIAINRSNPKAKYTATNT